MIFFVVALVGDDRVTNIVVSHIVENAHVFDVALVVFEFDIPALIRTGCDAEFASGPCGVFGVFDAINEVGDIVEVWNIVDYDAVVALERVEDIGVAYAPRRLAIAAKVDVLCKFATVFDISLLVEVWRDDCDIGWVVWFEVDC